MTEKIAKIFILDDESAIKENLTLFLESEGFEAVSYSTAENALGDIISGKKYALGIVDIRLPGMNGEEFIQKACKYLPEMKYIIHTGSVNFEINNELAQIGICEKDIFKIGRAHV